MKINKEWFENVKNIIKFQVARYSLSKALETPTEKGETYKVTDKGPEPLSNLEPGASVEIDIVTKQNKD